MRKPKKPRLFVEFRDGTAWTVYYKRPNMRPKFDGVEYTVHAYAPVTKPKVCVWVRGQYTGITGCRMGKEGPNFEVGDSDKYVFCPYCGGKIKVKR